MAGIRLGRVTLYRQFWGGDQENSGKHCVAYMVNNVRGKTNITDMWKNHFNRLLNSSCDNSKR